MAWQKKHTAEHHEMVDLRQGMHVIPLHDPETGTEHRLQLWIGHHSCPTCGHVKPSLLDGEVDVARHVEETIAALNESHRKMRLHAEKHRVPLRNGKGER